MNIRLAAVMVLMIGLALAGWAFIERDTASQRPEGSPQSVSAILDTRCSLNVENEPFRQVIARLSAEHGVPIAIADYVEEPEAPVSCNLSGLRLRSVLSILTAQAISYGDVSVEEGAVVIGQGAQTDAAPRMARVYPVSPLVEMPAKIEESVPFLYRSNWSWGQWPELTTHSTPQAMILVGTEPSHADLAGSLLAMHEIAESAKPKDGYDLTRSEPAVAPEVLAALRQKVTVEFDGVPIPEAIDQLARAHRIPIFLNHDWTGSGTFELTDETVTASYAEIPLGQALRMLLRPLNLNWTFAHEAIMVSHSHGWEGPFWPRLYPVDDLSSRLGKRGMDKLFSAMVECVNPGTWPSYGSFCFTVVPPAGFGYLPGMLTVEQNARGHAEMQILLEGARQILTPLSINGSPPGSAVEQALAGPLKAPLGTLTLTELCALLQANYGLRVLIDRQALKPIGPAVHGSYYFPGDRRTLEETLRQGLRMFGMDLYLDGEVLLLTSCNVADKATELRVYDVSRLTDADFGCITEQDLEKLLRALLPPTEWGRRSCSSFSGVLCVRESRAGHAQMAKFLKLLAEDAALERWIRDLGAQQAALSRSSLLAQIGDQTAGQRLYAAFWLRHQISGLLVPRSFPLPIEQERELNWIAARLLALLQKEELPGDLRELLWATLLEARYGHTLPHLLEGYLYASSNPRIRSEIIAALGRCGDGGALGRFVTSTKDTCEAEAACWAIGARGWRSSSEAIPYLLARLVKKDRVESSAAWALRQIDQDGRDSRHEAYRTRYEGSPLYEHRYKVAEIVEGMFGKLEPDWDPRLPDPDSTSDPAAPNPFEDAPAGAGRP